MIYNLKMNKNWSFLEMKHIGCLYLVLLHLIQNKHQNLIKFTFGLITFISQYLPIKFTRGKQVMGPLNVIGRL